MFCFAFNYTRLVPIKIMRFSLKNKGWFIASGYVEPLYAQAMYQRKIAFGSKGCPFSCQYYKPIHKSQGVTQDVLARKIRSSVYNSDQN